MRRKSVHRGLVQKDLYLENGRTFFAENLGINFYKGGEDNPPNLYRSLLNVPNRIPFDSKFLDTVTTMLMESQCMGGGGSHNGNVAPHHHQQSMGHFQFRDRKKSCESTTSASSLCSTPTRSGTTTPTQQNYMVERQMEMMMTARAPNYYYQQRHLKQVYNQQQYRNSNFQTNYFPEASSLPCLAPPIFSGNSNWGLGVEEREWRHVVVVRKTRTPPRRHGEQDDYDSQLMLLKPTLLAAATAANQQQNYEYRKRSNTLLSNRSDKRWPKRDMGPQFELRCCIDPEILRINVDRQYYFEDETVRVNGSVFHKRNDYNNLLSIIPRAKFNGIHIKMEDDCPQGGDDVRLCLLKSLGAHNLRSIPCVQCKDELKVYDKYPLIDGVFYISPVSQFGPKTEISLDGRRFYLQQLCARCLWSDWSCKNCGKDEWFDGRSFVLGTLYYYDIVSAGRCCPSVCQTCRQPLGVRDQLATQLANGNYATINEQMTCQACGSSKFHLVRDIKTIHVARGPSFCE
ncbi:hypothetical protein L5515_000966 [Caenorhabditis briggsae]|uniref:Headcase middle domain-containing protein n=1 Tax=Caenorhabditis briggsae TaxID=6238 RepID=A0AAE9E1K9_CAEBR|nr:hypothetical protein L5515_000966 [Caenorhabditis briggsae]